MFTPRSPRRSQGNRGPGEPHPPAPPGSDPRLLPDLQSTLQDGAVGDAQLAEALVRLYAQDLSSLATALLATGDPPSEDREAGLEIVRRVLSEVVAHRERIWAHLSLRAWLVRLVIREYRRQEQKQRLRQRLGRRLVPERESVGVNSEAPSSEASSSEAPSPMQKAWQRMVRREQMTLLLREVSGLSQAEIAYVLDLELYPVEYWLKESRLKIAGAQPRQPAAGLPLEPRSGEGESSLADALREFLPPAHLSDAQIEALSAGIAGRVENARSRRRAAIALREAVLVGVVLGALFLSCRAAGLLPKEIIHRYKTPTPTRNEPQVLKLPTPAAPFYYYYAIRIGDTLESIAERAGIRTEDIINLNGNIRFQNGKLPSPPNQIMLPASFAMDWRAMPTPVTPIPQPPPLTIQSDPDIVRERILESHTSWHTLWLTLHDAEYGPPGYLGPPLNEFTLQVWYTQPDRIAILGEFDPGSGELFTQVILGGISFLGREGQGMMRGFFVEPPEIEDFLEEILLGNAINPDLRLQIQREDQFAGRQVIVVDVYRQNGEYAWQVWVDAITGVILRRLQFSQSNPDIVLSERAVRIIAYDQDFPSSIFDPASLTLPNYASDHTGRLLPQGQSFSRPPDWPENGHAPRPIIPAPQGFDPARQPLFLMWPERWESNQGDTPNARIAVLAGRYFLGYLPLEERVFHACKRSPDGWWVALSTRPTGPDSSPNQLSWFHLKAPEELHTLSGYTGTYFALSPDSRKLALITSSRPNSLVVVELETGERATVEIGDYEVEYLAWSPDQKSLAMLAFLYDARGSPMFAIKVVELQSGEEVYTGAYDPANGSIPSDSPTHAWGLSIPIYREIELPGCMEP